jgi:threonine dehydratase
MTIPLTLEDFLAARDRIRDHIHRTPLHRSTLLGRDVGVELHFKCENFQKTGSFKARGALNKLLQMDTEDRKRGVVTISAGNHAQALAWAAGVTGTPCTVVMPANASKIKADASASYGAEVVLHGTVHEAFAKAHQLERDRNLTYIHAFDDPQIIAGAGSSGLEILEQIDQPSLIVVPIGGGGQIAGVAGAVKLTNPNVRVVGVEPEGASTMYQSLRAGHAVRVDSVDTVADGLAPPMAGELNYEFVKEFVEEVVLVSDDEIIGAMGAIFSRAKLVAEPSGAAALAALISHKIPVRPGDRVVAIVSGGNVGPEQLAQLFSGQ